MKTLSLLPDGRVVELSPKMTALFRALYKNMAEIEARKSCTIDCHVGANQVSVKIPPEPTVEKVL